MKLREYLDKNMMMIKDFVALVGVTEHTVYNWLNGTVPLRLIRLKIAELTNGQIKLEDWEDGKKKKANRRVRSSKDNGVQSPQRVGNDEKTKSKVSAKRRKIDDMRRVDRRVSRK